MPTEVQQIQQAYRFALDPTPRQVAAFRSHVGAARFAFNWGLATIADALDARAAAKEAGTPAADLPKIPGHFDLCKLWTAHKDNPDHGLDWVAENFVGTYQAALRDAHAAWKGFFDSRTGRRAGRAVGRPRFKAKHRARASFQVHGATLYLCSADGQRAPRNGVARSRYIRLPKIGAVRTHESTRKLLRRVDNGTARIVRATISLHSDGRWYAAITAEVQREVRTGPSQRQRDGGTVGVDFGARDVITLSTGDTIPAPRHLHHALDRLGRLNRKLARAADGSARRERTRARLAKAHARVGHLRLDATHKATSRLVHAYDTIVVEGWNVAELMPHANRKRRGQAHKATRNNRNRALADANIGTARWQLESKARWYGSRVVVTGEFDATGRICSQCGSVRDKPVPPGQEWFHCPACGATVKRRINSALVLAAYGKAGAGSSAVGDVAGSSPETVNGRGGSVSPGGLRAAGQLSVKRQAGSRVSAWGDSGTPGG